MTDRWLTENKKLAEKWCKNWRPFCHSRKNWPEKTGASHLKIYSEVRSQFFKSCNTVLQYTYVCTYIFPIDNTAYHQQTRQTNN